MRLKQLSPILLLTSLVWLWCAISATAQEIPKKETQSQSIASVVRKSRAIREIPQISEIELPHTSARMLVQTPSTLSNPQPATQQQVISITGVKANATDKGVEVILETTQPTQLQVINRSTGNNFIVDVLGGQLRLPDGNAFTFRSDKPSAGITEITVANIDLNTVRVTVVGEKALPTVELYDDTPGLVFAVASQATATQQQQPTGETPQQTPEAQGDDAIELVVTGEQDSYRVPNSSVGTRTDTPLRDIPQTINVVPQEVLRDQNATILNDALLNVPGVVPAQESTATGSVFIIRGFSNFNDYNAGNSNYLRNGLREGNLSPEVLPNIERVEVLKGPASVLYGTGNLGGTINLVTEQPLRDPFFEVEASVGSYDYYRGAIDLSGPLNDSRTLLYRLNAGYLYRGSFIDFFESENLAIAPVIRWDIGERTRITLEGEYTHRSQTFQGRLPAEGTLFPNPNGKIPRNRFVGDPDGRYPETRYRLGYRLEHEFSDNWSIQQAFQWKQIIFSGNGGIFFPGFLAEDKRTLVENGYEPSSSGIINSYDLNLNLTGKFATGSIGHQLVFGVDLNRYNRFRNTLFSTAPPFDVFDPVYDELFPELINGFDNPNDYTLTDTLGVYIQDQVTLTSNLKLLLGGRFDWFETTSQDFVVGIETSNSGDGFSPRVGIVYQPIQPLSLYASYSRSFAPVFGTSFEGDLFEPELGTQYEVGVKADVNERLALTLSLFDLTRTGVLTEDTRPGVPRGQFAIQTGEQRSRGVELSIAGEILPGWNMFAGYAYTDARLTEDNILPVGDGLPLAPEHSVNLWTTYEIQRGALQGLGFGLGLFFVGDREVELPNTYQLPSYFRTDAAVFYKRGRLRAALNFKNLFDVEYFEPNVAYGEPFTVQSTVSWQF